MTRIAAFLTALLAAFAPPAFTTSSIGSPDYSDLWWNAAENGWGAHITQQDGVLFVVLYVYDEARRPRFLVAPDVRWGEESPPSIAGALYRTTGPVLSGTFDPARVESTPVGELRLHFPSSTEAWLEYTVGGTRVRKTLTRQSWRAPKLAGEYVGGLFAAATATTCPLGLPSIAYAGSLAVSQAGDNVGIDMTVAPGFAENGTCRMSGRLVPSGALASVTGTYSCEFSNGNITQGSFELTEIESGPHGFGGRYAAVEGQSCRHAGYLGGTRRSRSQPAAPPPED